MEAAVVGGQKHHTLAISLGVPSLRAENRWKALQALLALSCGSHEVMQSGVSMGPGLTAFTRMWRSFKSGVQVARTNARGLVAL